MFSFTTGCLGSLESSKNNNTWTCTWGRKSSNRLRLEGHDYLKQSQLACNQRQTKEPHARETELDAGCVVTKENRLLILSLVNIPPGGNLSSSPPLAMRTACTGSQNDDACYLSLHRRSNCFSFTLLGRSFGTTCCMVCVHTIKWQMFIQHSILCKSVEALTQHFLIFCFQRARLHIFYILSWGKISLRASWSAFFLPPSCFWLSFSVLYLRSFRGVLFCFVLLTYADKLYADGDAES